MSRLKIITESLPQRCEVCHQQDHFEPATGICSRCNVLFESNEDEALSPMVKKKRKASTHARPPIERPIGTTVKLTHNRMILVQPCFSFNGLIGLVFFSLGPILGWKKVFMTTGSADQVWTLVMLACIPFIYVYLTKVFNSNVIEVDRDILTIYSGPLPWFGSQEIPVSKLDQLYSREIVERRGKTSERITYNLDAKLKNGKMVNLLSELQRPDIALFIEQQLEQKIGIKDRVVKGELPRQD